MGEWGLRGGGGVRAATNPGRLERIKIGICNANAKHDKNSQRIIHACIHVLTVIKFINLLHTKRKQSITEFLYFSC